MIKPTRYTPAPIAGCPHMEPMGQGEWVKYEDYAAIVAQMAEVRNDALNDAAHVYLHGSGVASWDFFSDAYEAIRGLRTQAPAVPAEPAQVTAIPHGKWCACGYPHETGGPCWECRAIAGPRT